MIKKPFQSFAILWIAFLAPLFTYGQVASNYVPLICEGEIPRTYRTASAKKYERDIKNVKERTSNRRERKNRELFALETNFVLDDLLQSGLVLFNDTVSNYLNEVTDFLIGEDEDLKRKVTVYTLRSSSVNAFATNRGNIFVTLGLLAQLENEAQLAFILAHELAHYQEKHSLELFLQVAELEKKSSRKRILGKATFDEVLIEKNRYSKEKENEADAWAIRHILRTDYSLQTLETVFDVLKYAYLPFDDVPFDRHILESSEYLFPEDYWLEEVQAISGVDVDADDTQSTHPNLRQRRQVLLRTIEDITGEGRQTYLVSEASFREVQRRARFEIPMLHLHRERFARAIYSSFLLLQQYPDELYLQKIIAKALYINAKYKSDGDYSYTGDYEDIEGESQQIYHLLEKLNDKEMTVLALRYAYPLHRAYPQDTELATIVEDLFVELAYHVDSLDEFFASQAVTDGAPPEENKTEADSKYDKIRRQKEAANEDYWRSAFLPFAGDSNFQSGFQAGRKEYERREELDLYYASAEGRRAWRKEQKIRAKKGVSLGINRIVVINPFYLKLDARKDNTLQYIKTEVGQVKLRELLEQVGDKAPLQVATLDVSNLRARDTDKFNDIRMLNDWYAEQVAHDDLSLTPGFNQAMIDGIADKYRTDYFLWTGVISLRERGNVAQGVLYALLGVSFPPLIPYGIYIAAKPNHEMLFYAILFDVRSGRREVIKFEFFEKKDTNTLLKAHFYDALLQISAD